MIDARRAEGFTVWFTGLPAAGKTTIAGELGERLQSRGVASVLFDGDVLRRGVNRHLGYDPASRAESARRAAQSAFALARQGSVALVALVSPYAQDRRAARERHESYGVPFIEVYLATPLAECERRDPKGLYARARRGEVEHVTGLDDPYEPPRDPDLVLGAVPRSVDDDADAVVSLLRVRGLLRPDGALVR